MPAIGFVFLRTMAEVKWQVRQSLLALIRFRPIFLLMALAVLRRGSALKVLKCWVCFQADTDDKSPSGKFMQDNKNVPVF